MVGVLAALSLIALYLSAVSPTARMGIVAIAGLFPAGAVVSAGLKAGFFCYGAAGLLGLLLGSRRRLSAGVSMAVLAFYMLVVGLSPSVVRACIMQAFVLAAPLFKRDSDGLTSLGAALLVILLANPFAAGSISLQLSLRHLGLVWLSPKLYRNLSRFYTGTSRAVRWAVNFLCANVSAPSRPWFSPSH